MNLKKPAFISIIFFYLFTGVIYAATSQGDITVQAEGYGVSKKDALIKAKRAAVEQGIGMTLVSQTEVKNFEVQKDFILAKTIGAVKKYLVIQEKENQDGIVYIKIQATVSVASIKEDLAALKILLESMDRPRMLVAVQEENGAFAQTAIINYLSEKEFELVDPAVTAALMQSDDKLIQRAFEGDSVAAAKIGAANNAEYIIVGKVKKSLLNSDFLSSSGIKSGQAILYAKVINCSNAKIIASKSSTSAFVHTSKDTAMAMAAEKAAKKLMDQK